MGLLCERQTRLQIFLGIVKKRLAFWVWIYFYVIIIVGTFFIMNLTLAVISVQFNETKKMGG